MGPRTLKLFADGDGAIPLGAHLVSPRKRYRHHGIYVGNGRVIHYAVRNNCKHFSEWCIFGASRSAQVEKWLASPRKAVRSVLAYIRNAMHRMGGTFEAVPADSTFAVPW